MLPRFQSADHWEGLQRNRGGIWVDDISNRLERTLEESWAQLEPGDFMGGPVWGSGPLTDGRFATDTRRAIEGFRAKTPDVSERFLGDGNLPCWMMFKQEQKKEKVLLISGCDEKQMSYFGTLTRKNHEHYAAQHGYETQWHVWDPEIWGSTRQDLVWAKLKVVCDALAEGTWDQVWWLDADAAVMKMDRKIDSFLHPDWAAVFSEFVGNGRLMLSTGVFGCRRAAEPLLRFVWETENREDLPCNEETALIDAIDDRPDLWADFQMVGHELFNGVLGLNIDFSDPVRTFICHMVSRTNQQRRQFFWGLNRALGI